MLLLSGRLPKCSCLKFASSLPTFKLLFWSLPVLLRPDLAGPSQPIPHPSPVAQVLLPMVADLLRAKPLSSWTPKNRLHPLLIVKNLPSSFPSPVTVILCSSLHHCCWPCLTMMGDCTAAWGGLLETIVGESTSPRTCSAGRSFQLSPKDKINLGSKLSLVSIRG